MVRARSKTIDALISTGQLSIYTGLAASPKLVLCRDRFAIMPSGGPDATPVAAPSNAPSSDRRIMSTSCGSSASRTRQSSSASQLPSSSSSIELSDLTHDASVEVEDSQLNPEDPSNSVPPESPDEALTTPPNGQAASPLTSLVSISTKACYQCYQSVLGLITLATALISLLFYGFRSYKLAVWTAHNDELQSCTGLIQVRHVLHSR